MTEPKNHHTPRRQTQSYLRDLFSRRGVAPRHRFGQNFLIDLNIHDLIAEGADVGPGDVVLEIGPGAGAMTSLMASKGAAVVAVDIDPAMVALTTEATEGMPNVRVFQADALKGKHTINPVLIDNVRSGLAAAPGRRFKLVSNLPYNIATPILTNLLVHPDADIRPERMVVTIQLELAERLRADPQGEDYGALSILVQALADVELLRTLPPHVFWPRPKVESAVVRITPNAEKRALVGDIPWFQTVVRQVFTQRRKNLRRVLHSFWRHELTKEAVDEMLNSLGLTGMVRAEALNVEEWIGLTTALKARLGDAATASKVEADDEEGEDEADEGDDD
jgi:16S rRNA (adenine1518-N6/adenine1519-N6)-dimethyltransferase